MAKEVGLRYQSADALLEDLRRLQASLAVGSGFRTRTISGGLNSLRRTAAVTGALQKRRVKVALLLVPIAILAVWWAAHLWRPSVHQPSPEAKRWYDRGAEAIRAGAYYQASKALEHSTELDDSFGLAHARLAETYVEIDNTDKAMEELLHALSL